MFIVVTGLDGSGTSTIAQGLHELDPKSVVFKTPGAEFRDRDEIDKIIRRDSKTAHMLYYLSSTVYLSDYIKKNYDIEKQDIYVVRYLIDTVVSNKVAGIDIELDYEIYGNKLLVPDLTLFVETNEKIREERITKRGKSELDKVLDDIEKRKEFLKQYKNLLTEDTLYVDNSGPDIKKTVEDTYKSIQRIRTKK